MRPKRGLIISDLHCGHDVGLTMPQFQPIPPPGSKRSVQKKADLRKKLCRFFMDTVDSLRPIDFLLVVGDCIEGKGNKSEGVELLAPGRDKQAEWAATAINYIRAKTVWMVYGTPYHTGIREDWEDQVQTMVGAKKIEAEGHYDINGLAVTMKHFIGNAGVHSSKKTALNRAVLRNLLWAARDQQPLADLVLRAHVHRFEMIQDATSAAAICPALQGLGSRYGARQLEGLPVDFGLLSLEVQDKTHWRLEPHLLSLTEQAAQVNRL